MDVPINCNHLAQEFSMGKFQYTERIGIVYAVVSRRIFRTLSTERLKDNDHKI